jgi:hypothetical protein
MKKINKVNNKVNQNRNNLDPSLGGWDQAISYAKSELDKVKFRVTQIKVAIRIMEEKKVSGELWPGDEASQPPSQ